MPRVYGSQSPHIGLARTHTHEGGSLNWFLFAAGSIQLKGVEKASLDWSHTLCTHTGTGSIFGSENAKLAALQLYAIQFALTKGGGGVIGLWPLVYYFACRIRYAL